MRHVLKVDVNLLPSWKYILFPEAKAVVSFIHTSIDIEYEFVRKEISSSITD